MWNGFCRRSNYVRFREIKVAQSVDSLQKAFCAVNGLLTTGNTVLLNLYLVALSFAQSILFGLLLVMGATFWLAAIPQMPRRDTVTIGIILLHMLLLALAPLVVIVGLWFGAAWALPAALVVSGLFIVVQFLFRFMEFGFGFNAFTLTVTAASAIAIFTLLLSGVTL
jgi:hypothetical protein